MSTNHVHIDCHGTSNTTAYVDYHAATSSNTVNVKHPQHLEHGDDEWEGRTVKGGRG
jgi:hypothetical protein